MESSHTPPSLSVPRLRARLGVGVSCALLLAASGACRDAPTDPTVGLVAGEAGGALAMGVRLPDPTSWATPGLEGDVARAVEAWHRSWVLPLAEARQLRATAYPVMARGLVEVVSPEALAEEAAVLGEGVRRALELDAAALPPTVAAGLVEASARHAAAKAALAIGDTEAVLDALIRGGDALREVGPEAVARDLVAQVQIALGRVSPDDSYSDQDLERLQRLVVGARQAVEGGDWVLAIRRAYYAKGLLTEHGQGPS